MTVKKKKFLKKKKKKNEEGKKKVRKEKEIVIELKKKDENLGMPLQVGKCILKKKLANGYDRMETWSWVIDKGVLW